MLRTVINAVCLLASCLTMLGQGFGSFNDQPFMVGGASSSGLGPGKVGLLVPGVAHSWVDKDLTTNAAISIWTDEIQQFNLVQATGGNQPFMSTTGAVFYTSGGTTGHFLDATNMTSSWSIMFLVYYVADTSASGGSIFLSNAGDDWSFVTTVGGSKNVWRDFSSGGGTFTVTGPINTNVLVDIETGANPLVYTNGVRDNASSTFGFALNTKLTRLYQSGSGPSYVIRELDFWTNTPITATIASNLYYYRTNVYGGN